MLHILYILAFTVLAFLAISNLIRNLLTLGLESQRGYGNGGDNAPSARTLAVQSTPIPHPEMLDEEGRVINEPLLIMRSMTVEDARERLDALYDASPGGNAREPE
jgi:Protein of unknown function (DUF2973)